MIRFRTPRPGPVEQFSPSFAAALETCAYRAAFSLDSSFSHLRRGSAASALGNAAHKLAEQAAKGRFKDVPLDALRENLEWAWDEAVADQAAALTRQWTPANPPVPTDWPGYHLTKARILRTLTRDHESRLEQGVQKGSERSGPRIEQEFTDASTGLHGRPDRVERRGGNLRVVDLKTGIRQEGITEPQRLQLLLYAYLVHATEEEWPVEVVVRDASGREHVEPLDPDEAVAAVGAIKRLVEEMNSAVTSDAVPVEALARPAADSCRWCPYRVSCAPYWEALEPDWPGHSGVVGVATAVIRTGRGDAVSIEAAYPAWMHGREVVLGSLPAGVVTPDKLVAVVDVDRGQSDESMRARWSTYVEAW